MLLLDVVKYQLNSDSENFWREGGLFDMENGSAQLLSSSGTNSVSQEELRICVGLINYENFVFFPISD